MIHKICPECSTAIDCAAVVKLLRSSCFRGQVSYVTNILPDTAELLSSEGFALGDQVKACPACIEYAAFGTSSLMSQWVCYECGGYVDRDQLTYFLGEPQSFSRTGKGKNQMNQEILEARIPPEQMVWKYNRIASIYDLFGILMESKARQKALDVAAIKDGEKILEVALGTGLNFVEILKRNPSGWIEGIDISVKMMERARKRISRTGLENYRLNLCDCRQLPFEDKTFDVLMNQYLFDILPLRDFFPILFEFKRVLRDGGRLVLGQHDKRGEAAESNL